MMTNRKGLSDVVTTVLVILLVIVAIATIWAFVQRPVQQAGTQVGKATACAGVELQLLSCEKNVTVPADINTKLKIAQGTAAGVRFIVNQADGTTQVFGDAASEVKGTIPTTLNTGTVYIVGGVTGASNPVRISAVPIVTADDGSTVTCAETAKVTCP